MAADLVELEIAMKAHYEALKTEGTAVEILRAHCLSKGLVGLLEVAAVVRAVDPTGQTRLTLENFCEVLLATGNLDLDLVAVTAIFTEIDAAGCGTISLEEFILALRPPVSEERMAVIELIIAQLAVADDRINTADLIALFSGDAAEIEATLALFGTYGDGYILKEDFILYYLAVSAAIEDDLIFLALLREAWGLN